MSYQIAIVVPSAAVASAGTLTAQYPANTSAGDFAVYGHKMWSRGLQKMFSQDDGNMSVSFGASDITVTYSGATSIPANTQCTIELNIAGSADAPASIVDPKRVSFTPMLRLDLGAPDTADTDGVVESQNLTALGVYSTLAFNGVYGDPYGNAKAIIDVPRNIVAAWTTTAILTVTGKDEYGDVIIEKSGSGTSLTGKKAFKEITSITTSADITSLTVGTGDVLGLPVFVAKASQIFAELKDGVALARSGGKAYITSNVPLTDGTYAVAVPKFAGTIKSITTILQGVITTNDAVLTFKGGTAGTTSITTGVVTIAVSGAAVGDIDSASPSAANTVAADDKLMVVVTGTPGGSKTAQVTFEIDRTGEQVSDGTFVAGVQTLPTATTGDVRGTYDPVAACNNALTFGLLVSVPDPAYRGVDNYDG